MISFIAPFGTEAMAGFGVARNLEYLMFMPTTAMCMAVTSIVGGCGTCAALCPMKNICIRDGIPKFGTTCVSCGASQIGRAHV